MVSASNRPSAPQPTSDENSSASSLGTVLSSCMDMLRIEDATTRKKAVEFVGSVPPATTNAYGKWITAVKAIADACAATGRQFSQSEMCDFLTVAANGVDTKRAGGKAVSDATFHIYVDIMENYNKLNNAVKVHYPRIIIDTIAALDKGIDTRGETVGVYGIDRYYQERKQTAPMEDPSATYTAKAFAETTRLPAPQSQAVTFNEELVQSLMHITGRSKRDLENSLSSLQSIDIKKIRDLSSNYKKLQKYTKLANSAGFKKEVEKDLGRKLTDNQLQHAVNSIRKANTYIENVLDGKFVPHGTHGINHVKHNLEYGYQLMGLMEPRKRRAA